VGRGFIIPPIYGYKRTRNRFRYSGEKLTVDGGYTDILYSARGWDERTRSEARRAVGRMDTAAAWVWAPPDAVAAAAAADGAVSAVDVAFDRSHSSDDCIAVPTRPSPAGRTAGQHRPSVRPGLRNYR